MKWPCGDSLQCDELRPKCSRCSTLGLVCNYASKVTCSSEPPIIPPQIRDLQSFVQSESICKLNAQEYALFKHYIEHTSRDLTVDSQEQFTLQIGIPILAFQSRALMCSILALSAVCKCSDIIKQSVHHPEARENVIEMLNIADQYHMESLHKIQAALPEIRQYDHVLANAAMMGMYGSGSHCIRIWLSETIDSEKSRKKFIPRGAQWTRLFRAVRMAYTGLLQNSSGVNDLSDHTFPIPLNLSISEYCTTSAAKPSRSMSDHFMHPIIGTTIRSALGSLIGRVNHFVQLELEPTAQAKRGNFLDLQACQISLEILNQIVIETFYVGPRTPDSETPQNSSLNWNQNDVDEIGRLLNISPWLHRYAASITSMLPSKLPRRFIMAFVHKVPTQFLTLVEEIIGLIHTETIDNTGNTSAMPCSISLSHQLALDIFAHWLVLVTLLSDVWWIGNIGIWELKHIVSFAQRSQDQINAWGKNEDWWPKSMYHIAWELGKFT
ncbi:hypothetical protein N7540_009958 [Penicillium herquei]|nr:hypothetical protein N7540_009958 [Penicillium herquei]